MFKKSKYLLIFLLIIILQDAVSQNSHVSYYMNLPQNYLLNPAIRPTNLFNIGVPLITDVKVNIDNNFVNFSDIILPGKSGDSLITFLHPDYNVDNFIKKLKKINSITPAVNVQLFGLSFYAGKDRYISLDISERIQGNFALPKDLFVLALKGNNDFLGKTINLNGFDAQLKYFHEFGLGFSKSYSKRLRLGARGKLLFGVANVSLNNKTMGLKVNTDYSYDLNADMTANISGPIKIYQSSNKIDSVVFDDSNLSKPSSYFNTSNMGLALDLGAVYDLTDKISLSGSITDLGYIRWKKDATTLKANSTFKFSGFNISDVVNGTRTFDEIARDMVDSLKNSFTITDNNKGFNTYLPVGVTIGGRYNLTKNFSLGILSHSAITGKQFREALTFSANLNIGNRFSALSTSIAYTAENHSYDNLGVGLAFRLGFLQVFVIGDKIPIMWNRISTNNSGSSVTIPDNWNTMNLRFGVNLAWGNKVRKVKDKPMLTEQK
jgi:opacity protein-like surface antigen